MQGEARMLPRWWMGGVAASGAACFTQFMDTAKVHAQTQQEGELSVLRQAASVVRREGFVALNNGLSAAVLRQMVYSTLRFHFYEVSKQRLSPADGVIPFPQKVLVAAVGGAVGGFASTPADVVNVRTQNDLKLPPGQRRNYKHVLDGLWRVYRAEGLRGLFSGATTATGRSVLMTVGQLSCYDQIKTCLLRRARPGDHLATHFLASTLAVRPPSPGSTLMTTMPRDLKNSRVHFVTCYNSKNYTLGVISCTLTQPFDVVKTRTMNAKPGEFKGVWDVVLYTAKAGPLAFFKGYVLRCARQVPHTVLTFVFFERLRLTWGVAASSTSARHSLKGQRAGERGPMGSKRLSRWYFGGVASAGAACCTHPLDLIKVHLQTQQEGKLSAARLALGIARRQGLLALYNGLSASLLRQLTYSTTRFGIYEVVKQAVSPTGTDIPFVARVGIASVAGAAGGFVGTPGDMINVRMQNDIKLPPEARRNYKHALDGLARVWREEGVARLFSGASAATSRAVLMTVGQLSFYDQVKAFLLARGFSDGLGTHFLSSLTAGAVATTLTQPLDVLKTRTMNAKPGEFQGLWSIVVYTARLGPLGFFKGYVPAFVRLGPHTILTFVFMEQLRQNFGVVVGAD
ncbi:uncharacterized protein LOC134541398 [Bacillus rossius redtenbacheri]|uniref:uncharacterized protein LOC134541398 n=1 Tax=Bacillus rossius redtenbacheri TaxID=93214 RepID=UPI002FDF0783